MTKYLLLILYVTGILINPEYSYSQSVPEFNVPLTPEQRSELGELHQSKRFYTKNAPDLTIFTFSGDIIVVHNPSIDHLQLDLYVKKSFSFWTGSSQLDNYRILLMQRNDDINATVEKKRRRNTWSSSDMDFTFYVQTPKKITSNLRTLNGDIFVHDLSGKLELQTTSGNLVLQQSSGEINAYSTAGNIDIIEGMGQINTKTVVGNVNLTRSDGEIRIRTTSGNITGDSLKGSLICITASGNITAGFEHAGEGVYLETASGDIDLSLPARYGYQINAKGLNIDLSEFPGFEGTVKRTSVIGNVGDGSIPIQLKTASGRVVLTNQGNR